MNIFLKMQRKMFAQTAIISMLLAGSSYHAHSNTLDHSFYDEIESARLLQITKKLLTNKKLTEAHKVLSLLAKRPEIQIRFEVAKIRSRRLDEIQNLEFAIASFKNIISGFSNKRGHAAYELARIYRSNPNLKKQEKAIEFYQLAAVHGFTKAYAEVAHIYAYGIGVESDLGIALHNYELAAKHQSAAPIIAFARYLARTPEKNNRGIDPHELVNAHYANLVAEATQGYAGAAKELARLHLDGDLKPLNIPSARKWLRQAVIGGDIGALRDLALLELNNNPDKRNLERSLAMLKNAADAGNRAALAALNRLERE